MYIEVMVSKIHRAVVTDANLNYVGSITIDTTLAQAANLAEFQKVQVVNVTNGARFDTYVMMGEADTGTICLNGAAAHLADPRDIVIIIAYGTIPAEEAKSHKPTVILVDSNNKIVPG